MAPLITMFWEKFILLVKRVPSHYIVTGSAWGSRIVIAALQLLSIRVLLEGLGAERYAVFLLTNALLSWYMLADMGVGISLQNYISEYRRDQETSANYLATASILCLGLFLFFSILLYFINQWLSQTYFKNFIFISDLEKGRIFLYSGMLFLMSGLGAVAYKAWYAHHKGYLANIMPAIASVIGFVAILIILKSDISENDKLFYCILGFISPPALISVASLVWQIRNVPPDCWKVETHVLSSLLKRASKFWILYALAAGVLNVDFLILSQYVPPSEISIYGIGTKIFGFAAFFYVSLYAALWPHFTEDISKNNWSNVRAHIKKSFLFSASFIILFTIFLLNFMPWISNLLSPSNKISIPLNFILMLGVYHLILVWVHGYAIILQSMSDMKVLLVCSIFQTALSIIFQIFLVEKIGIYGATLGMILSFLLTAVWLIPRRVFSHIKTSRQCNE
ncbi:hypothetical protein CSQ94_11345 [Janthinobacterium sp. BJB312]|nr:hypothetical protein CSQ94_11345 [Janthinobacterium sp. BJB312]